MLVFHSFLLIRHFGTSLFKEPLAQSINRSQKTQINKLVKTNF